MTNDEELFDALGLNKWGYTEEEHDEAVLKVDLSHKKDYDGSRRKYADSVSTSEVLTKRRNDHLAGTNGHGGH